MKTDLPLRIIRTNRRKTASISVIQGQVQVNVPRTVPQAWVEKFIAKRRSWIQNKLHQQTLSKKNYVNGESFTLLGKNYSLRLNPGPEMQEMVCTLGDELIVQEDLNLPPTQRTQMIQIRLACWYKNIAERQLPAQTRAYARKMRVEPKSILVKHYKTRWGSCSRKNDIRYNWKIIIAPQPIVDYVIVHELCHILEHNHSRDFWQCVERFMPDFKERQLWLRTHGQQLFI